MNIDAGLNGGRHGRERRHDPVARMLHFAATLLLQCGTHDLVVLAKKQHKPLVAQFLCLLGRVTEISEQNRPNGGLDIGLPSWVSWDLTEKRIDRPVAHFDDVVSNQSMSLSVHALQGLSVGTFGETEDRPFLVIEPIRDVTDLVSLLNGKIEFVRGGDIGGRRARRLVSIQE